MVNIQNSCHPKTWPPRLQRPQSLLPNSTTRHHVQDPFHLHSRRHSLDCKQTQFTPRHPFQRTPRSCHNRLTSPDNKVHSQRMGSPNRPSCIHPVPGCQGRLPKRCPQKTVPQHAEMRNSQAIHQLVSCPPHRLTNSPMLRRLHFPLLQDRKRN